jgi:hypothetical protein
MHAARRQALVVSVAAAITGARLTVTALGRAMDSSAAVKHCIKRADRLLSNPHLQHERRGVYLALAHALIGSTTRQVVIVDWAPVDEAGMHFLLRAATPVGGRALTLYDEVHTLATREKPKTHARFLARLQEVLPAGCRPIVVTDAGFRTPWFKQVERLGWDWVGRIRHRHLVQFETAGEWLAAKALYSQATRVPQALGRVRLTQSRPIDCELILYRGKAKGRIKKTRLGKRSRSAHSQKQAARQREPWLLATSLPVHSKLAKQVVRLYALRMQVEEAFRDLKSSRFGLSFEQSRTGDLERLQLLLLIAALAMLVLWLLGKAAELTQQHRAYQPNTVRHRAVLSTLFLGLQVVNDRRVVLTTPHLFAAAQMLMATIRAQATDY